MSFWDRFRGQTTASAATEVRSLAEPTGLDFSIFGVTPSLSGATVTPATAMRVPAVSAGVKTISEAVSILSMPAYWCEAGDSRARRQQSSGVLSSEP